MGLVAEKAGGRPLAQQFRERLFTPLGLAGTSLPGIHDRSLAEPYAHGYMYGGTAYALVDKPYPDALREAAEAGTLAPVDHTHQNPSYATAAGGAISTAEDLAAPDGQKYGYGIAYQKFGPNAAMFYHGGELPGFNSFIGHDPDNDVTLVVWTNLTLSPDDRTTAQAMLPTLLDQICTGLDLPAV
ncbi:serine hydrolase [Streptomyces virginiae]|uniref:serine hydrolase n=1 Tax=Streptomyces virginiae TaxID=1961 RepID=UPI0036F0F61C